MRQRWLLIIATGIVLGGLFLLLRPGAPAEAPQVRTLEAWITAAGMVPGTFTVREGDRVTLLIKADQALVFHLHGYDLQVETRPEDTVTLDFTATVSGRFAIEDENSGRALGILIVQPAVGG